MSFEFPFEYADVEELGRLFYPMVRMELRTVSGWKPFEFLIDTGADMTTVPVSLLPLLGINVHDGKQTKTLGVGGIMIKSWNFSLPIRLDTTTWRIQANAVETKENGVPFLLGRKDIFESRCNLYLDSKRKVTVISLNEYFGNRSGVSKAST
ncbi:retroviral-like aspartic protease [Candidatus Gottesmanbacteria bacterium]|nr:retroviral-like aspartic protease [Candidatus Gottesmanbacteria bacterium]